MKTVDVILPVYNEEQGLTPFHATLRGALDSLQERYHFHIIYVLDRSSDKSFEVLMKIAMQDRDTTVLHLSRRFGHQMSLVAGLDHSAGDAVIMMDCDGQHPPELIPVLLDKYESGYDVVHAVRKYDATTPALKRLTSHLFYRIQNSLSPIEIPPGSADFRLISRKVADVFTGGMREHNQFLRGLFRWVGFRTFEVPFVSPPRATGETKYRPLRLLAFSIIGITSFSKVPLRFASLVGFLLSAASTGYGLWLLIVYFTSGYIPPGYTSIALLISLIGGVQLTVLGIIGEYIGGIFDEVKRRPLYIVDEIVERRP